MTAYYNEIDEFAAQWLRNLIAAGVIAPGDVDTRDIRDVKPSELRGYKQCHFFAGIGVWSYALRRAGWPDNRSVWTGSCPCQPFSAAGRGDGFADERHLWPHWHHLIRVCEPEAVFGEQVASQDGLAWLDLVQADMEGSGYAFTPFDLSAAGVGAPHIRQRLWFVGDDDDEGLERHGRNVDGTERRPLTARPASEAGAVDELADRASGGRGKLGNALEPGQGGHADGRGDASSIVADTDGGHPGAERQQRSGQQRQQQEDGRAGVLADTAGEQRIARRQRAAGEQFGSIERPSRHGAAFGGPEEQGGAAELAGIGRPGPTNGFWRDADWLFCRDGKWRPVEPGTFPLAYGVAGRMGRLRAYGNAIVAEEAQLFIEAFLDAERLRLIGHNGGPALDGVFA